MNQSQATQNGWPITLKVGVSVLVGYWAGFPTAIQVLIIFMGMDFVTGLIQGAVNHQLSSDISLRGLFKKIAMLLAVLFIHLLDGMIFPLIGMAPMELGLEKIFAIYLTVNEIISVVENLARSGVPFPIVVIDTLAQIKKNTPRSATQEEIDALGGVKTVHTVELTEQPGTKPKTVTTTETTTQESKPAV